MNYLNILEESYNTIKNDEPNITRLEYISEHIFRFTTYEQKNAELFAKKCIEVCLSISNGKTYEYIENEDNHMWYLIMVNMPFFQDRIEWGGSIRGAWWDFSPSKPFVLHTCGIFVKGDQITEIEFNADDWKGFICALHEFTKKKKAT